MPGKVPPVPIQARIYGAILDPQVGRPDLTIFAVIGQYADETGVVGLDETGANVGDSRWLVARTGLHASVVSRSLTRLESLGYLQWQRAWDPARRAPLRGAPSAIKIILPTGGND
jgi:hypothetical protein